MKFSLKKKDRAEKTSVTNWYGSFREEHILDNWWAKVGLAVILLTIIIVFSFVAMSFLREVEDVEPGIKTELEDKLSKPIEIKSVSQEDIEKIQSRLVPQNEITPVKPEEIERIENRYVPLDEVKPISQEDLDAIRNRKIE